MAGNDAPSDGVKLMYGQPRSRVAQAYSDDAGSTGWPPHSSGRVSRSSDWWTSPSSKGGSVEATLMTTT